MIPVEVEGYGPVPCSVMICGEAPGETEVKEGRPFVGKAGQLLNQALGENGTTQESIYITNIVKFRPPRNRTPSKEEISLHLPILIKEVAQVRPEYVLLLGNTALFATTQLENEIRGISKHRGLIPPNQSFFPPHVIVYATYHPSAALRSTETKKIFFEDVKTFLKLTQGEYRSTERSAQ